MTEPGRALAAIGWTIALLLVAGATAAQDAPPDEAPPEEAPPEEAPPDEAPPDEGPPVAPAPAPVDPAAAQREAAAAAAAARVQALLAAEKERAAAERAPAEEPAPPPPAPPPPAPENGGAPPAQQPPPTDDEPQCADDEDDCDESVFGWFSVSPQVGLAIYPAADITVKGVTLTIEPRTGFVGKLHLDLGGDGLAVEIAPLIAIEGTGKNPTDVQVNPGRGVGGGLGGDYVAFGGELSLVYRFAPGRFFPHLGLGFHGAYLTSDAIEHGAELYARIPLGFNWYVAESFALTIEVGLMYGVTGIRKKVTQASQQEFLEEYAAEQGVDPSEAPADLNDPWYDQFDESQRQDMMNAALAETMRFGAGFGFDFMIGVRFP